MNEIETSLQRLADDATEGGQTLYEESTGTPGGVAPEPAGQPDAQVDVKARKAETKARAKARAKRQKERAKAAKKRGIAPNEQKERAKAAKKRGIAPNEPTSGFNLKRLFGGGKAEGSSDPPSAPTPLDEVFFGPTDAGEDDPRLDPVAGTPSVLEPDSVRAPEGIASSVADAPTAAGDSPRTAAEMAATIEALVAEIEQKRELTPQPPVAADEQASQQRPVELEPPDVLPLEPVATRGVELLAGGVEGFLTVPPGATVLSDDIAQTPADALPEPETAPEAVFEKFEGKDAGRRQSEDSAPGTGSRGATEDEHAESAAPPEPVPSAHAIEPVVGPSPEPAVFALSPVVEPEPVAELEPVAEPEPEPVAELEPVAEPEPEPVAVLEPVIEPEPTVAEPAAAEPPEPAIVETAVKPVTVSHEPVFVPPARDAGPPEAAPPAPTPVEPTHRRPQPSPLISYTTAPSVAQSELRARERAARTRIEEKRSQLDEMLRQLERR